MHMCEIIIISVYFLPPPLLFYLLRTCRDRIVGPIFVFYGSKDVLPRQLRPFWGANKKMTFSTIFGKNTRNSLFLECKTSIGNRQDSAVKFPYRKGFSALRIEWCDRHLCHVTGSDHTHRFVVKQHLECV